MPPPGRQSGKPSSLKRFYAFCTRSSVVPLLTSCGSPAVITTRSPSSITSALRAQSTTWRHSSSVEFCRSERTGYTPQDRDSCWKVFSSGVAPTMGSSGRNLEIPRALRPVIVTVRMARAPTSRAVVHAASQMALVASLVSISWSKPLYTPISKASHSACAAMRAMAATASTG